jgi:hypothetical protein
MLATKRRAPARVLRRLGIGKQLLDVRGALQRFGVPGA